MPSPPADSGILRRRDVLLGFGRGAAGLALLSVTAAACGSAPPEIDPLQAQLDLATADSDMARAATAAAAPPLVPALTQIAAPTMRGRWRWRSPGRRVRPRPRRR